MNINSAKDPIIEVKSKKCISMYVSKVVQEYMKYICEVLGENNSELVKRLIIEEYTRIKSQD